MYFEASELVDRRLMRVTFRLLTCFVNGELGGGGGVFRFPDPSLSFIMLIGVASEAAGEQLRLPSLYQDVSLAPFTSSV